MVCNTEFLASTDFNPRTHKECDPAGISAVAKTMGISIHALTKSATSCNWLFLGRLPYFNPRTHKECDVCNRFWFFHHLQISIHALTKSATRVCTRPSIPTRISIHALTKSATLHESFEVRRSDISIHALTKSATCAAWILFSRRFYFNPRTHKECDHNI